MTEPAVDASDVSKTYRRGEVEIEALAGVSFRVDPREFVAVMGPSGSGKTTLLNCLAGLDTVDEGEVRVNGTLLDGMSDRERTRFRGQHMGFVFQEFNLIDVLTAERNAALPLLLQGVNRAKAHQRARSLLERVGLGQRVEHKPPELSGGQQQRVAIARALVHEPAIVWADEPTGNLDKGTGNRILDLLEEINQENGTTLVVVSHDPSVAERARRIVRMDSGRIKEDQGSRTFQVVDR